jgi:prevent-host-death family protein
MVRTMVISTAGVSMREMKASEFKAKCLQLMDDVAETGEPVVVTKNGRPISRLEPFRDRPTTLFGSLSGAIEITGDIVSPCDVDWEAGE